MLDSPHAPQRSPSSGSPIGEMNNYNRIARGLETQPGEILEHIDRELQRDTVRTSILTILSITPSVA